MTMERIHETALIDPAAQLADDVEIGAFSIIGPQVRIGPGSRIGPHVVITGRTTIGRNTRIFQFASVGEDPQDKKYAGERTYLEIGDRNRIREHVTVNAGTAGGGGVTRIGNDCLLMAGCHVAHDCQLGDRVIMVNHAGAAGHCVVEDDVIIYSGATILGRVRLGLNWWPSRTGLSL